MTTFTKEQLIARANHLLCVGKAFLAQHPEYDGMAKDVELFGIALASLEATAVMYASQETLDAAEQGEHLLRTLSKPSGDAVIPLYTAPLAPVSVPDELLSELLEIAKKAADIADECAHAEFSDDSMEHSTAIADWERRASMQGKAEPVSQPYKLPDGWVACSERMPHIGVPVITCCGDVVQYAAYAWDGKEWQDWYEEYDKLPVSTFTHWHSRPTAPKQEM